MMPPGCRRHPQGPTPLLPSPPPPEQARCLFSSRGRRRWAPLPTGLPPLAAPRPLPTLLLPRRHGQRGPGLGDPACLFWRASDAPNESALGLVRAWEAAEDGSFLPGRNLEGHTACLAEHLAWSWTLSCAAPQHGDRADTEHMALFRGQRSHMASG